MTNGTIERTIIALLAEDRVVSLPGFGVFQRIAYEGVSGTNPKTGDVIRVDPKVLIHFVPDESLRFLNGAASSPAPVAAQQVDVEARLAESLSISSAEAQALLTPWIASKVAGVRATVVLPFQKRSRHQVDLGEMGVLEVNCVEVSPALEATLGPSHRRFLFRPTQAVSERLGATTRSAHTGASRR